MAHFGRIVGKTHQPREMLEICRHSNVIEGTRQAAETNPTLAKAYIRLPKAFTSTKARVTLAKAALRTTSRLGQHYLSLFQSDSFTPAASSCTQLARLKRMTSSPFQGTRSAPQKSMPRDAQDCFVLGLTERRQAHNQLVG